MGLIFNGNGDVIKAVDGSLTVEGLDLDSSSTNINAGIVTGTSANFTGNVSVGGVLTYEDVKNVDSVGIVTARTGIHIDDSITHIGDTNTKIRFPADDTVTVETGGTERLRINPTGITTITGQTTIATTGYPQLILKDSDSNSPNDTNGISLRSANNTEYGFIGQTESGGHSLFIKTVATTNPIRLQVNSTTRFEAGNSGCYVTGVFDVASGGTSSLRGDVYIPDKLRHIGDDDTAIRFPAADTFSVETAGQQNVQVTGTRTLLKSPSGTDTTVRLQHQGNSGYGDIILDRTVNAFIISNDPSNASSNQSYFSVKNKGNTNLYVKNDGKIGINTTTPYSALEVQGDGGTNDATITFTRHGTPGNDGIIGQNFYRIGTDSVAGIGAYRESAMDDAYIAFHTQPTGGNYTERLRITSAGNVLIGTDSTGFAAYGDALTIYKANHVGLTLRTATNKDAAIYFADSSSGGGRYTGGINYNHSNNYMNFTVNETERLRIDSNGRLMVGQNSAYAATGTGNMMLTVTKDATSRTDAAISNQSSGDNASAAVVLATHGQDYILEATGSGNTTDGVRAFRILKGTSERLRIDSNGNVGINYVSPTAKLSLGSGTDAIKMLLYDNTAAANEKYGFGIQASELRQFFPSNSARFSLGTISSSDGSTFAEKIRLESSGILKLIQGATQTNALQSYTSEGAYAYHYVARTTSGSDRYRRMFDIASCGDSSHGSAIRFMTSKDGAAAAVERMRIMHDGGVVVQDDASLTHNQNHPHRSCPGLLTVHNGSGESNRTDTTSGVYAPPTGGFVNYADYELAAKLINISNSNCNITMAKNGEPITINDSRDSWSFYNKLPNYLLGLPCTDNINNSDFTLTLYADMLVFLLRNNGWNSIGSGSSGFSSGWTLIETDTNIGPAGSATRLYVKSCTANSYSNWDNNSAMYFFRLA